MGYRTAGARRTKIIARNGNCRATSTRLAVPLAWIKTSAGGTAAFLFAVCKKSELKCGSGECVPKSAFCNKQLECKDGSDEPPRCSCRTYLKLTDPGRLCDGTVNCRDKSDEKFCSCSNSTFKCET